MNMIHNQNYAKRRYVLNLFKNKYKRLCFFLKQIWYSYVVHYFQLFYKENMFKKTGIPTAFLNKISNVILALSYFA